MANEDNKGSVAGSQDIPQETVPSQRVGKAALHDWVMIHYSSEGWDEPSLFKCSKCGALRVSSTYEAPKAEGCPAGAEPQDLGSAQTGGDPKADRETVLTASELSPIPTKGKTPEERLAEWDAQTVLDILERLERGQLLTREDAEAKVQVALADVLPMDAKGRPFKPGDRAHLVGDDNAVGEFTVLAVGRSTVITDAGGSFAAEKCLHSD